MPAHPEKKLTVIGGGIVGLMEAYFAFIEAQKKGETIRVTAYEKNQSFDQTTTAKLAPVITPDAMFGIVPPGPIFAKKIKTSFTEGGIRVDDVPGINDSEIAKQFISDVELDSKDENGRAERTQHLMELGKEGMKLWEDFYETADPELKQILKDSNFNPCREPKNTTPVLRDGYHIDLIQRTPNAANKAEDVKNDYASFGYKQGVPLSPKKVMEMDPTLTDFCILNSEEKDEELVWKNDAAALWSPGGSIDAQTFVPKFVDYLTQKMGQYTNEKGQVKNNFRFKFDRRVTEVSCNEENNVVKGLMLSGGYNGKKTNKHAYRESEYVFCPGESVGTLRKFGFDEPTHALFAGASLKLSIPVSDDILKKYQHLNNHMELHEKDVLLAWQAKVRENKICIAVAGTKAFYGDQAPHKDQAFARNRALLQLNIVNGVIPELISIPLGKDTKGLVLTEADMQKLEEAGIAQCDVAARAVSYDNFPTLGRASKKGVSVKNARVTTGLGSGGVSYSLAAAKASQSINTDKPHPILTHARASRKPG